MHTFDFFCNNYRIARQGGAPQLEWWSVFCNRKVQFGWSWLQIGKLLISVPHGKIEVLKSIDSALSPLLSLTDILSGETYITVSAVIQMVQLIKIKLLKEEEIDTQLTRDLKLYYNWPWESIWMFCSICWRYGNPAGCYFLRCQVQIKLFQWNRDREHKTGDTQWVYWYQCTCIITASWCLQFVQSWTTSKKRKTLGTLFKEHDHEEASPSSVSSPEQQCKKELECYLSSPRLDFEEDALAWWKSADHKYPSLSSIARKYLCVYATSSTSKRVFSFLVTLLLRCVQAWTLKK